MTRRPGLWPLVRLGLAAASAVLLLLAVWIPEPRRGPPVVGRAVVASGAGADRPLVRSFEAPDLLVDRDDPSVLYLSGVELASGGCRFFVSPDAGASWQAESTPYLEPYTRACGLGGPMPQNVRTDLVQATDGSLFYVFGANDPGTGTRSVLLARSRDRGRSWRTTVVDPAGPPSSPEEAELNFQAHVAVDPDHPNLVYVMWRRAWPFLENGAPARRSRPWLAVSRDGGGSFGPASELADADLGPDGPRPLVVDGTLYAFYLQAPPPLPRGSDEPSPTPPLARLLVAASTDGGRTWVRSEIAAARDASDPVPAYDPRRRIFHVVWHDNRDDELDVWYSSSPDGVTWGQPLRLNDDAPGRRVGQHYPQLSVSPGGRLDVAWYDWRDDPFPPPSVAPGNVLGLFSNRGKVASVYLTSSADGGRTWSPNVRVNDQLVDRTIGPWGDNYDLLAPPAVASTPSAAVVAWSDTRDATVLSQAQDLVVAGVTFERTRTVRVTGLQAALVGGLLGAAAVMWGAVWASRRATLRTAARADPGPAVPPAPGPAYTPPGRDR